jgi:hypothetical protein
MHLRSVIIQEVAACLSTTPYLQAPPITRLDHSPREVMLMESYHHAWFPSFSETLYCVGFQYTPKEQVGENSIYSKTMSLPRWLSGMLSNQHPIR